MTGWREMAARLVADAGVVPQSAEQLPETFGLPDDVADGLRRLPVRRPPRIDQPEAWPRVVADAIGLARDGWAAKALALGWSAHDVFATGPDGDASFDGLAVWLSGRTVAALTANTARTTCGAVFYRDAYLRPTSPRTVPVFLWDWRA